MPGCRLLNYKTQVAQFTFSSKEQASACMLAVNQSLAALLPLLAQLAGGGAKLMGGAPTSCRLHCMDALSCMVADGKLVQHGMLFHHEPSGLVCDRYLYIVPKVVCHLGNVLPSPRPSRHKGKHSNRPTL